MKINNYVTSTMRFMGSSIKKIKADNNIVFLNDDEVSHNFGMDVDITEIHKEKNDTLLCGIVELSVNVSIHGLEDKSKRAKFQIIIEGCFSVDPTEVTKNDFMAMLYINGGSCLYSIARATISSVSANMFDGCKITLPMVNMAEFIKMKIQQEKERQVTKES